MYFSPEPAPFSDFGQKQIQKTLLVKKQLPDDYNRSRRHGERKQIKRLDKSRAFQFAERHCDHQTDNNQNRYTDKCKTKCIFYRKLKSLICKYRLIILYSVKLPRYRRRKRTSEHIQKRKQHKQ